MDELELHNPKLNGEVNFLKEVFNEELDRNNGAGCNNIDFTSPLVKAKAKIGRETYFEDSRMKKYWEDNRDEVERLIEVKL